LEQATREAPEAELVIRGGGRRCEVESGWASGSRSDAARRVARRRRAIAGSLRGTEMGGGVVEA
jgi:hypothetical protein